jgi:hypothetical protein
MPKERRVRVTITIQSDVHKAAQLLANEYGSSFSAAVEGCIALWLYQTHKPVPEAVLRRACSILPHNLTETTRAA